MKYSTSITKKGQITIPKDIRQALELPLQSRIYIDFNRKNKTLKLNKTPSILDMEGIISQKRHHQVMNKYKIKSVLDFRKLIEEIYERI